MFQVNDVFKDWHWKETTIREDKMIMLNQHKQTDIEIVIKYYFQYFFFHLFSYRNNHRESHSRNSIIVIKQQKGITVAYIFSPGAVTHLNSILPGVFPQTFYCRLPRCFQGEFESCWDVLVSYFTKRALSGMSRILRVNGFGPKGWSNMNLFIISNAHSGWS